MTDHDQQLPRFAHADYGEAVTGMAARPRLFGFADSQFRLVRSVLEWAYGYSDETIWHRRFDWQLLSFERPLKTSLAGPHTENQS